MMRIKSPLSDKHEVVELCEAGADELFCGVVPGKWRRKFRNFSLNQRAMDSNFSNLKDLESAICAAHKFNSKVHVALNAFFCLEGQYEAARDLAEDVLALGADGIIFADPVLLSIMDRNLLSGKDAIVGCDAVIFNSASADFYKTLGATRIVIPRSMTIEEMRKMTRADKSLEYEAFIINDLCFFEDGLCAYCKEESGELRKEGKEKNVCFFSSARLPHRGYMGGCRSRFKRCRVMVRTGRQTEFRRPFTFWGKKNIQGCGVCAMHDLNRIGVDTVKILDRNLPKEEKVRSTKFIKKCADLLSNDGIRRGQYFAECRKAFKKEFGAYCDMRDCYYPQDEVWKAALP